VLSRHTRHSSNLQALIFTFVFFSYRVLFIVSRFEVGMSPDGWKQMDFSIIYSEQRRNIQALPDALYLHRHEALSDRRPTVLERYLIPSEFLLSVAESNPRVHYQIIVSLLKILV
jgi:hypothetical protein